MIANKVFRKKSSCTVLFIVGSAEIGGTEKQIVRLAKELKSRGIIVNIWFTNKGGPLVQQLVSEGIEFQIFSFRSVRNIVGFILTTLKFSMRLVKLQPKIVYPLLVDSILITVPLARIFSRNSIIWCGIRGFIDTRNGLFEKVFEYSLRMSDHVICNSDHLVDEIEVRFKICSEKIVVIPNGVDIPSEKKVLKDHVIPQFVTVSNFHSYKGHYMLLESIMKLHNESRFTLIGKGNLLEGIRERINQNGMNNIIQIIDNLNDVKPVIDKFDVMIHPSETEGLSNAILEGIANGLPVLAFNIGGNHLLIKNGYNGFLIDSFNIEELAEKIDLLANDLSLRMIMSENSIQIAKNFSWDNCTTRYISLIKEQIS